MHISKYFTTVLFVFFISLSVNAQQESKDVNIKASGSGKTLEEAKQAALRSAIEQAFGAFISSKTEMLNDQVVADQMASVSSGNIKSFELLNQDQLPDGRWSITLNAVVSVDKLTSFVAAKGIAIEIKGGMFALNIKQQLLNEQGEIKAIAEMVGLLHEPMQISFDYVIKSGDPKSLDAESKNWEIPLAVTATTNKNIDFCANYCIKTLQALSLSADEVSVYKSLNKAVFPVGITYKNERKTYFLRKQGSINILKTLTSSWEFYTRLFTVKSGMDLSNGNGEAELHNFSLDGRYNNSNSLQINFLTTGQRAAYFSWNDRRTLAQIEQMTGYEVQPRGVVSPFKYGGFVVFENDEKCLIAGIADLGLMNWSEAKRNCEELVLNGYSDWRLPTINELKIIKSSFDQNNRRNQIYFGMTIEKVSSFSNPYWSSENSQNNYYQTDKSILYMSGVVQNRDGVSSSSMDRINRVRPVRYFSKIAQSTSTSTSKASMSNLSSVATADYFSGKWVLYVKTANETFNFPVRFEYKNGAWDGYYIYESGSEVKLKSVQMDGNKIYFKFNRLKFNLNRKDNNEAIGKMDDVLDVIAKRSTTSN